MWRVAERPSTAQAQGAPTPAELLRAALEKIVFFEWRLSELAAELSGAQSRCASAEVERGRAEEDARAADQRAKAARMQLAQLEAERARLAALLSHPAHGQASDPRALEAERTKSAHLQAELDDARRQVAAGRAERDRWLSEMIEQAKTGDEEPAALAQFISELRGEIIALRDHQKKSYALLAQAGIAPPSFEHSQPPPAPQRESEPVEQARQLWAEGRIGGSGDAELAARAAPVHTTHFASPAQPAGSGRARAPEPGAFGPEPWRSGVAARALADQCLRNLTSPDSSRREQAARHLAAVPVPAAAPVLASALGAEQAPKARAQLARALAACGGEGAAEMVAQLQAPHEHPLVRLAAAEALCILPARARAAVAVAAHDPAPAVRRRAAALAAAEGFDDLLAQLVADGDASVRAACDAARREAPAPVEPEAPPPRDPSADVLQAVQAALFGLTEDELAEQMGVPADEARALVGRLLSAGRLGRRGKRLVLAEGAAR
jgi:hypothetical protein